MGETKKRRSHANNKEFEEKHDKIPKDSRIVIKFGCGVFLAPFIGYFS